MNDKFLIKKLNNNIKKELESINFSTDYINIAEKKFTLLSYKIFDLKPAEANILKQTCISLGFDAAINKDAVTCRCEYSDAVISGSFSQIVKLCEKLDKQPFRLKKLSKNLKNTIIFDDKYFINGKAFDFNKTYLMGILNVTPNSFSDGGEYFDTDKAFQKAVQMYNDGASIIDIGGESTKPTAEPVSWQTECERILPVIKKLKKFCPEIIVSVDTIHPETIVEAVNEGADILNTVANINVFEKVFDFLKEYKIPIVITHSNGIPPKKTEYDYDGDIIEEIFKYFSEKIDYLKNFGLSENLLILDAGIGFGKSVNNQFEIIKRADEFFIPNCPLMLGISRKSFISTTFGEENRDEITKIYNQHLISKGVNILRVHDVKGHLNLINCLDKIC